jgi:hypothetical protein
VALEPALSTTPENNAVLSIAHIFNFDEFETRGLDEIKAMSKQNFSLVTDSNVNIGGK